MEPRDLAPSVPRPVGRRGGRAVTLLLALVLVTAVACGSSDTAGEATTGTRGGAGSTAPVADGSFPVAIEHKYGETTIAAVPTTIVTVGLTDQDALLALGVTPAGVTDWLKAHPSAIGPWATDEVDGELPALVGDSQALNFEAIAALQPDLILGLYSGLTQSDYDTLSQIAPTVAQPGDVVDYGISWQDQTRTIGTALGKPAEAEALVTDVEAEFEAVREANPPMVGAEGIVATVYNDKISIYAREDGRGRFMESLGFVQSPEIAEIAGDQFSADVSMERMDLVDVDTVVWIVLDVERDRATFAADPLYSTLPVHTGGHDVYVANGSDVGSALNFQSVLSIPFLLDELAPQLAAAVPGNGGSTGTTAG